MMFGDRSAEENAAIEKARTMALALVTVGLPDAGALLSQLAGMLEARTGGDLSGSWESMRQRWRFQTEDMLSPIRVFDNSPCCGGPFFVEVESYNLNLSGYGRTLEEAIDNLKKRAVTYACGKWRILAPGEPV